jgi:enterochelin esterase family protein
MRHAFRPVFLAVFLAVPWPLAACGGQAGEPHGLEVDGGPGGSLDGGPSTGEGGAADASLPDSGPLPDCSRTAQASTAPPSLYDAFVKELATIPDQSGRDARVAKLIADISAAGGAPLQAPGGDRVVFLVRGAPAVGPWSVAGSFTAWKTNALAMTQVAGTDLYVVDTHIAHGTAHAYKLLSGTADTGFAEDALASNVVWDGIDHKTVGYFNGVVHAEDGDKTKGRIIAKRHVHAATLGDDRDVFVYLPPKYDDGSCAVLPHLLVHDGNESLTRGDFAKKADETYAANPELSAILVFVALSSQNVRMDEYTFNTPSALADKYGAFLLSELEPQIKSAYRVCGTPESRGQSGASLGGLISTYLAFQHPEEWGYVGAQSASLFWDTNAMITRAGADPKVAVRFYLDHGCPNDNCIENQNMSTALTAKGYDVDHVEVAGAQHDWAYWADRFPQMLTYFRAGKAACTK